MIAIAAVIGAAALAGVGLERRLGARAVALANALMRAVLWLLLPIVAFFNIASLELTAEVGAGIGFGYAALAVALAAAYAAGRLMRLPRPSVGARMLAAGFGNTGYLGLPFAAALFGLDALPDAVAYDTLVSGIALVTIAFSVGAAFGSVGSDPSERVMAFLVRNPPLWATLAGFLAPAALAPDWAVSASQAIVFLILPLGFFAVGVTLAETAERDRLPFPPPLGGPVAVALAIKLLLTPAVVLGLSAALLPVPDPYLVQPGMATAINTLVVANEYGLDRSLCAEAIAWSTVVVVAAGLALALL